MGSGISTSTEGIGNAGSININASESISLIGVNPNGLYNEELETELGEPASGIYAYSKDISENAGSSGEIIIETVRIDHSIGLFF